VREKSSSQHEEIMKKNTITFENGNRAVVITAPRDASGPFLNRLGRQKTTDRLETGFLGT